jgi:Sec-independent protein secretion pathway component TatC
MWPNWKTSPARWQLLWATIASVALPWMLGEFVKTFYQPGLVDQAERSQLLIDFIVAGSMLFALTMVLTYAIGCWITAVMHGPRRDGDAFPAGQGTPQHDD